MLIATFVATIFVPLFFTVFARRQKMGESAQAEEGESHEPPRRDAP
jgi:hypothetical protein